MRTVRHGARLARAFVRGGCAALLVALLACLPAPAAARASEQPIEMAAPYEYMGWGDPQPPASVIEATGVGDLTLAFVIDRGRCNPEWDGTRPLLGGVDEHAIEAIRAAGGEVDVSFGGWSGKKLGNSCASAAALAGAYEKVIDAYSLRAVDVDIEHTELSSKKVRRRVVEALALVRAAQPTLEISITMPASEAGPEAKGLSLIADAAAVGLQPSTWTIMPFDFGAARTDMGHASARAVEALAGDLAEAYGISEADAYEHAGISTMNGHTDERAETVSLEDLQTMLLFARARHLARLTFWAVNRDRPCGGGAGEEECSAIAQEPLAFTRAIAEYHG